MAKMAELLTYVKNNPGETATEISRSLGIRPNDISAVLKNLSDDNLVNRRLEHGFFAGKKAYRYYPKEEVQSRKT